MITLGYTRLAVLSIVVVVIGDRWLVRTRLPTTELLWASYAFMLFSQCIVDGIPIGYDIVRYDPRIITGICLFNVPA
ncbi:lycopene cyclase domain-containing protein [Nakamurella antarctica]|uniref:Lycopene cyclase domain-containing protein n=1 Tax=Nakamurella antarctica TaxID=1902245 RepID=A0A3G9A056_9ACTN|nr:lycopene cyclase domain-containing protein [Nakamurella antarctica]AZI59161.1 lycopene cyclase domain-containing protein [Nakamurella antarctica]